MALFISAAPAAAEADFAKASALIDSWNAAEAAAEVGRLRDELGEDTRVLALEMRLEFYKGNYAKAVEKLQRIRDSGYDGQVPEERNLKAAFEITKGFAEEASKHFLFRYPPGKSEVLAPYALEALEAAYDRAGADIGVRPSVPVPVEVYGSAADLARATGLTVDEIEDSGTIAVCKFGRIMFVSPAATVMGYTWLDTLSHEMVHFVVTMRSMNNAPIWIQEAIAKFEEARWRSEKPGKMSPGARLALKRAVGKGGLIPFEKMHPSFAKLPSQEDTTLAFAEVEAAAALLYETGGNAAVRTLLDGLAQGLDDRKAVEAAAGCGFDAFLAKWKAYMKKIETPSGEADFDEGIKFSGKEKSKDEESPFKPKSEKANRFARLADILLERGRMKAAAVELRKAVKEVEKSGKTSPYLRNKLARCLVADPSGYAEAGTILKKAIAAAPAYPTPYKTLGGIDMAENKWDAALEHITEVVRINPFDMETHALLFEIHKKRGNEKAKDIEERNFKVLRSVEDAELRSVAKLISTGDGFLNLNSRPFARVFIDGEDAKRTTPLIMYPLKSGSHTVTLQAGETRKDVQVELKPGDVKTIFESMGE